MANPSRFAGWFNAAEYAFGCKNFPSQLTVDSAPSVTGAGTITVQFGQTETQDGQIFFPLATNAPIRIGSGSNSETVTPSAVSSGAIPGAYDNQTFTAMFSNLHGKGDPTSSASIGLQEAINDANARGGGVVVVDAVWTQLGGTTAILNAAVLPTNGTVSILDNRAGSGQIQTLTVTIPNAQMLTLNSVPTQLLPAPGAGVMYDVIDCVLENVFKTAAYTGGGAIGLYYDNSVTNLASGTAAATFLTSPTANQVIRLAGALASTLASAVLNKGLFIAAATADFAAGAGSMIVKVAFRTISGL